MLGFHARGGRRALDRVEPVHALRWIFAPLGIVADQACGSRDRLHPERKSASSETMTSAPADGRIERSSPCELACRHQQGRTAPACLGTRRLRSLPLARQSWRSDGGAQEVNSCAVFAVRQRFLRKFQRKLRPLAVLALEGRRAASGPDRKDRGAHPAKTRPTTLVISVVGIAINLDRAGTDRSSPAAAPRL